MVAIGHSLDEWFARPVVETVEAIGEANDTSARVFKTHLLPCVDKQATPNTNDVFVVMVRNGVTRICADWEDTPGVDVVLRPGDLQIMPPQFHGMACWYAPVEVVFVRLPPGLFTGAALALTLDDSHNTPVDFHFQVRDGLIQQLVEALCVHTGRGGIDSLYVESLTQSLVMHILRHYAAGTRLSLAASGRLSPMQQAVLDEFIDAHLNQKLALRDMASLLHVSVPHFERLFRATYGCAPYRYVQARRIERARALLLGSRFTVYEIAQRCGFSDQSHFTRCFTRAVGVSPARFASHARKRPLPATMMESSKSPM